MQQRTWKTWARDHADHAVGSFSMTLFAAGDKAYNKIEPYSYFLAYSVSLSLKVIGASPVVSLLMLEKSCDIISEALQETAQALQDCKSARRPAR